MTAVLEPMTLVKAPLRNRLRVDLKAPVAKVWSLVGDLARLSDYSVGLERVTTKVDARGHCTEYTCYFKPMAAGEPGIVSTDKMKWYEPNRGWASSGVSGDAFGFSDDLHTLMLEPSTDGTLLTMDSYYDAADIEMMKAHMHEALSDIGKNLLARFGGRLIHCYVSA